MTLIPGRLVHLRATAEGFGETVIPNCQSGERLRVVLGKGATVVVIVTNEADDPMADVYIRLWRYPNGEAPVFLREARTDEEGRASFSGLTAGPSYIKAIATDCSGGSYSHPEIPQSGTLEVEVTLVSGRIVQAKSVLLRPVIDVPSANRYCPFPSGPIFFR